MTDPRTPGDAAPAAGRIHDLGYARYVGARRPAHTRWQVITRHLLAHAWKRWWRYKLWLGIAVLITGVIVAVMVLSRSETVEQLPGSELVIRVVDELVFWSVPWFVTVGFLVSLTTGAGVIAGDRRSGAFTFYFARPVRAWDYVLGKLVGLIVLQLGVMVAPFVVIAAVRLGLSRSGSELVDTLPYLPKLVLIGGLGAVTFASMSLGVSSLLDRPRLTIAIWAGWVLVGANTFSAIALFALDTPALGTIDIGYAMTSLTAGLFDRLGGSDTFAPPYAAIVALGLYVGAGVALAKTQIDRAGLAGIGGG